MALFFLRGMNYQNEIIKVLAEAGNKGLSVMKVAIHVHHSCNTLFDHVPFQDVHRAVSAFLIRETRKKYPLVTRLKHGCYRLNNNEAQRRQLTFDFDKQQEETRKQPTQDCSLQLFEQWDDD